MIYYKPKDITYVGMAIWIDANAYRTDRTPEEDEQMYKYLYLIIHMISYKQRLFKTSQDVDDFSIYFASKIYLRYLNKKQFMLDENEEPCMAKIKSCVNYINKTIKLQRNTFLEELYKQTGPARKEDEPSFDDPTNMFELIVNQDQLLKCEAFLNLQTLHLGLNNSLKQLPFKKGSAEYTNLVISCYLTIIKQFTMCRDDIARLNILTAENELQNLFRRAYKLNIPQNVVLFNLPESMRNYVIIQCQRFILSVKRELEHIDAYQVNVRPILIDAYDVINGASDVLGGNRDEQA